MNKVRNERRDQLTDKADLFTFFQYLPAPRENISVVKPTIHSAVWWKVFIKDKEV